jgi:AcrR family transcriptional regulator
LTEALKNPPDGPVTRPLSARQEEILDVATALFAERGYSDTDTQALAEKLQVGKGTLYRYFPSKRELFLAAVDRVMRRLRERVDSSLLGIDDPLERVSTAIRVYLAFFADNPKYVELLIQERALFRDRKKPTFLEHREKSVGRWRELYRKMISEGRVRDMPVEMITDVLSDMVYGTMFTNYFSGRVKPAEEQARDVLEIFFFGILTPEERQRQGRT